MGIEYLVAWECEPKRLVGVDDLIDLLKEQRQGESLLALVRSRGDDRDPSLIRISRTRYTPDGGQEVGETTLAELLTAGRALERHAAACESCPAAGGLRFGCYGSVSYPLRPEVERWLLSLLPADPRVAAGVLLRRAVADLGFDGAPVAELRGDGTTFFVADEPEVRELGDGLRLSGDQLLQMLFFVGAIEPPHAAMLALFLGLVPHSTPVDALQAERSPVLASAVVPPGDGDPQVEDVRLALAALLAAVRLGVPLLVSA